MDNQKMIIFGMAALILLYLAVHYLTIDLKLAAVGINELRGTKGEHNVELDISSSPNDNIEDFTAKIGYKMGPYSGLKYENKTNHKEGSQHNWRHPPQHVPLQINSKFVPSGTPLPLQSDTTIQPVFSNGPSVDGTKNTPPQMFMFAHNQCKTECCPSTYSCSGGCLCTTPEQRDFINNRG